MMPLDTNTVKPNSPSAPAEGPKLTVEQLNQIRERVDSNLESVEDYECLDNYLLFAGVGRYILEKLKEKNIKNYSDFIYQKKHTHFDLNISGLTGMVFGVISSLKKYVAAKGYISNCAAIREVTQ